MAHPTISEPQSSALEESHEACTIPADPPRSVNWTKLDALIEDLPAGIPLLPPEDACNFEKYTHRPRHAYAPGDGWRHCARALEKYDAELCKGYREEIDTLLIFAGLFSAVVTAFAIESYQWLQDDSNDAVVKLLSQIAQSVSPSNTGASPIHAASGLPDSVSARINAYWFLALALSLSSALVSILCKQWVREFERNAGLTAEQFVGIHQTKLEGLEQWGVGGIISLLPLLLQTALAIFALGVLELLWQLHTVVAAVVCVPTVIAFVFYTATTVLPALQIPFIRSTSFSALAKLSECPYKSPQAMLAFPVLEFFSSMKHTITLGLSYLAYFVSLIHYYLVTGSLVQRNIPLPIFEGRSMRMKLYLATWHAVSGYINRSKDRRDTHLAPSIYRSLRWIYLTIDDGDMGEWIWHSLLEAAESPDIRYDDDDKKRGLLHAVGYGYLQAPCDGLRALALGYIARTRAPMPFVFELYMQNLNQMDVTSARHLINQLFYRQPGVLNAEETATLLRVSSSYVRVHVQEPLGRFILAVAMLYLRISDRVLRGSLLRCTLLLYVNWLGTQPVPQQLAADDCTGLMLWFHFELLFDDADAEYYREHPERLRQWTDVQALARLASMYAPSHEDPAAAIAFLGGSNLREQIRTLLRELMDIARSGVEWGDERGPFAGSSEGVQIRTSLILPRPATPPELSWSSMERPPAVWMEEGPRSHARHGAAPSDESRAQPLGHLSSHGPVVEDSVGYVRSSKSRSASGSANSLSLRAIVIHAPFGEQHTQMSLRDDEALPRTGTHDSRDGGVTDVRLSVAARPAALHAVTIDASSVVHWQNPTGNHDEALARTDGERDGAAIATDAQPSVGAGAGVAAAWEAHGLEPVNPHMRIMSENGLSAADRERGGPSSEIDAQLSAASGDAHDGFVRSGADAHMLPDSGYEEILGDCGGADMGVLVSAAALSGGTLRAVIGHAPSAEP